MATTDKGIAVKTDKMVVVGSGAINLRTEEIDLGIRTDTRQRTGVGAGELTQVVRLRGPLAEPKPRVDKKGAAVFGATVRHPGPRLSMTMQGSYQHLHTLSHPQQ